MLETRKPSLEINWNNIIGKNAGKNGVINIEKCSIYREWKFLSHRRGEIDALVEFKLSMKDPGIDALWFTSLKASLGQELTRKELENTSNKARWTRNLEHDTL